MVYLATLPSPVLWGYIIDKFCILWDTKCDSSRGSCALYDAVNLRIRLVKNSAAGEKLLENGRFYCRGGYVLKTNNEVQGLLFC